MTQQPSGYCEEAWSSSVLVRSWGGPQSDGPGRDPVAVLREQGIEVPADCPPRVVGELARMVSLLWLNGDIVPRERFSIDPFDQGLLFGRGLWECTRTFDGVPWLWPLHIDRLLRSAALLEIAVAPERLPSAEQVRAFVRALTAMEVVVRLNVTAGPPGKAGIVWMTAVLPPAPTPSVRLQSCRVPVPGGQPYLAWKTFQYGDRLRATWEARREGFDNALMLDAAGNVLEAANANVFVRLADGWATPAADGGGLLPGTVRRHLVENAPLPIREQAIPRVLLADVREAFVTNSNVGIVPVVRIDERTFPIGTQTRELARWLLPEGAKLAS